MTEGPKLVKVAKPAAKEDETKPVENEQVVGRPGVLSKIGNPVTLDDLLYFKSRMVRVPVYEELTVRLLFEIREYLKMLTSLNYKG